MAIRKRNWIAPDGTPKQAWLVEYRDQAGKRRFKQFQRRKEADAWELNARGEVAKGIHTPDSVSITVEKAAERWIDSVRAANREPTTVAAYDQHVRLHIVPKCGAVKLSQLTAPMVKGYLNEWLGDLSRPMAVRVLRSFKAILTNAQEEGLVAQNVALAVKPSRVSREKRKVKPPSKSDLRAILKAAEGSNNIKAGALATPAIYSGLRASELRGLAWDSLDLKRGTVTVEQRADAKGHLGPPKSKAGYRTIPLPSGAVTILKRWKLACPAHDAGLVFPSEKGKPLSHTVLMKDLIGPLQCSAGVTSQKGDKARYGMHAFRHAAASLWIDRGLNPKRVQYLMGHSSITVTFDTYGHLFETELEDADAIEAALFSKEN
ncbi:tyrosine-type recombinase/integrase [Qipengyuania nanhaisediminis]|uniref:Site-specific recombinase XerD n=1 Tax=Qipengyuania nanhaisediminis TaxID=604088 RepID=A0A1I5LAP5_9SPHN|nr:site-specific integrase [Qipengyuania nanhaisediminis]SFO94305.1 Site-specific recombinase XerD [Qipengyuania nanhaisediminis]